MSRKSTVLRFIEEERAKGSSDLQIKHKLLDAGWQMDIIKHALGERTTDVKPLPALSPPDTKLNFLTKPVFYAAVLAALFLIALFI